MNSTRRKLLAAALFASGILLWWKIQIEDDRQIDHIFGLHVDRYLWILLAAAALALIPRINRPFAAAMEVLRRPGPRTRLIIAGLIFIIAVAVLLISISIDRLRPTLQTHDENSYLIQMHMLAHGHLWHAGYPHDVAKFFESFYLMAEPRYASIYFPGTAILFLPTIWLNLPTWAMPLLLSALCVPLLYQLITAMFDGVAGILSAMLLLVNPKFHDLSIFILSQIPMLLFIILMLMTWLRWRERKELKWAAVLGAVIGFAAIIRPLDTFCLAVPIVIAMVLDLGGAASRVWVRTFLLLFIFAAPFVVLQLVEDYGITGNLLHMPHEWAAQHDWPGLRFGAPAMPGKIPDDSLPQKRVMYETFFGPAMKSAAARSPWRIASGYRFPAVIQIASPGGIAILLPLGLLALRRRRWVPCAAGGLYCLLYAFYPVFVSHYAVTLIPVTAIGVMMAIEAGVESFPRQRAAVTTFLTLFIIGACIGLSPKLFGGKYERPELVEIDRHLARLSEPSVVLFHFDENQATANQNGRNFVHAEPVYNVDVEFPDQAKIIRANDLGQGRNPLLYHYYAGIQPWRVFWLYDRPTGTMLKLGTAGELAKRYPVP